MSYYPNDRRQQRRQRRRSMFSGMKLRLLIGGAIVLFSLFRFYSKGQTNPITNKVQRVDMTIDQEVRMGLQSAPSMGELSRDGQATRHIQKIGAILVTKLEQELYKREPPVRNPYDFNFHLLADRQRINAFALPGGQIFITEALYAQLMKSDDQLAGVLGHEIGHVIERHGSERMAKGSFIKGLVGAAGVVGGSTGSASAASYVGNMMQMKYGRGDELESDEWGIKLMLISNYDPRELLTVMDVLEKSGGAGGPEFMSTHPRPANRKKYIEEILAKFPPELLESFGQNQQRQRRVNQSPQGGLDFDPNPNLDLDR